MLLRPYSKSVGSNADLDYILA